MTFLFRTVADLPLHVVGLSLVLLLEDIDRHHHLEDARLL